ncbi:MAG: hypothetical protein IT177_20130 [Acidobacteria bacterium]|nr:hypothetical protein [Acidobacteriota bacterium]
MEISDPERDADDPFGTMSIDLTPEQWQELRNLTGDFIEAPPAPQPADPAPSRPTPLRSVGKSERDDDSSVH